MIVYQNDEISWFIRPGVLAQFSLVDGEWEEVFSLTGNFSERLYVFGKKFYPILKAIEMKNGFEELFNHYYIDDLLKAANKWIKSERFRRLATLAGTELNRVRYCDHAHIEQYFELGGTRELLHINTRPFGSEYFITLPDFISAFKAGIKPLFLQESLNKIDERNRRSFLLILASNPLIASWPEEKILQMTRCHYDMSKICSLELNNELRTFEHFVMAIKVFNSSYYHYENGAMKVLYSDFLKIVSKRISRKLSELESKIDTFRSYFSKKYNRVPERIWEIAILINFETQMLEQFRLKQAVKNGLVAGFLFEQMELSPLQKIIAEKVKQVNQKEITLAKLVCKSSEAVYYLYEVLKSRSKFYNCQNLKEVKQMVEETKTTKEIQIFNDTFGCDFSESKCNLTLPSSLGGRLLHSTDPLQITAGELTHCCQKIGGAAESAVKVAVMEPLAGIYAWFNQSEEMIAQSFVWEMNSDTIVFDSIELANNRPVSVIYQSLLRLIETCSYNNVIIGTSYSNFSYGESFFEMRYPDFMSGIYTDTSSARIIKREGRVLI